MSFKALLYVQREIECENHLHIWMNTEAARFGIQSIAVEEPLTAKQIEVSADRLKVSLEDCLLIVGSEEGWELAKQLPVAVLPYVHASQRGEDIPRFDGAWMIVEGFEEVDYDFLNKCYQRAHNLPWDILTTRRCCLRELTLDDMDALFSLYEHPGVTDYMEGLYTREEEENYQRAYIENMYRYYGYGMWLVCKKGSGEVIGRAGLEHRDYHGVAELEMGYLIAPSEQRKGYATEICRAIMEYARENLDFPRINCLIHADNVISKHFAERLGFSFLEKIIADGAEMDRYIYCF